MNGARARALRARLDALLESHDPVARRAEDPVAFVHRYRDPGDQEVVGLVAALLAFGNVTTIRQKVALVLERLGEHPARRLERARPSALRRRYAGFRHRVWRVEHVATLLANAGRVRRSHGSLGALMAEGWRDTGSLRESAARLADRLRGPDADRGLAHLVPDPRAGSACKRILLYLRWMCRPADGIDLGLWPVPASSLIIPVDTHVLRIGRNLRLTERRDASWRTAEEITASLRVLDPADPVKYDFALCHLGVSRACPSRRDRELCERCVLRRAGRHW